MPLSHSTRETWRALAVSVAGVCAVCLLLVWQNASSFWQNDYQVWYSPLFEDVVRAWKSGEWPILTPYTWGAGNLGGEYQLGTFSLWHNAVLLAIWSLPLSLPSQAAAMAMVHLSLAASGVVMLLRQRGARAEVAAAGALSVALSGWLMTWGASQWIVALCGFAWVPWAWWSMEKALAASSRRERWSLPALFVYLVISAGSPFSDLMLAVVTFWLGARAWASSRRLRSVAPLVWAGLLGVALSAPSWWMLLEMSAYSVRADWGAFVQHDYTVPLCAWLGLVVPSLECTWTGFFRKPIGINCVVMMGGMLPLAALCAWGWKYGCRLWLHPSSRAASGAPARAGGFRWLRSLHSLHHRLISSGPPGQQSGSRARQQNTAPLSDPAAATLGQQAGASAGQQTGEQPGFHAALPGTHPPLAALGGLFPGLGWELGLVAVTAALCMIPLVGSFRWSFRWLPLFQLALAVAGASAWQRCAPVRVARAGFGLLIVVAGFAFATKAIGDWRLVFAEIAAVLLWWGLAWRGWRWAAPLTVVGVALATLSLLELKASTFALTYPIRENIKSPEPLDVHRLYLGVYKWDDSIDGLQQPAGWGTALRPGNTALFAGLHFVNGYSSFFPFGVPSWFYVVGAMESDAQARALTRPQADSVLALLGVDGLVFGKRYRALADDLGPEWDVVLSNDEATVYHRDPPRAAPAHALDAIDTKPAMALSHPRLTVLHDGRQEITLRVEPPYSAPHPQEEIDDLGLLEPAVSAAGPSAIAFARPYYPGYEAEWNGSPVAVRNYLGMVPLVELPAGASGKLTLHFRPPSLRFGVPLAGGALLVLLAISLWPYRRTKTPLIRV